MHRDFMSKKILAFCALLLSIGFPVGANGDRWLRQESNPGPPLAMVADAQGFEVHELGRISRTKLPEGAWMQAIARLNGGWVATGSVETGAGRGLLISTSGPGTDRIVQLSVPLIAPDQTAWWPIPITHDGALHGLTWLQGSGLDRLAVMAARWDGESWSRAVMVSPPGPGSQVALSATVLNGGDWMLTWTRHDGEDDEVVWSRGDGHTFSRPAQLGRANAVPDILPSVTATADGAVAAWSRKSENGYVLALARFDGSRWLEQEITPTPGLRAQLYSSNDGTTYLKAQLTGAQGRHWALHRIEGPKLVVVESSMNGSQPMVSWNGGAQPRLDHRLAGMGDPLQ